LAQVGNVGKSFATYPAYFCPLLFEGEFTKFGRDFGEAVGYSIEDLQRIANGVGQGSAKHFQDMLSGLECMKGAAEIGVVPDRVSRCSSGRWQEMPRLGASGAKFTLWVGLCEFSIEHCHFRRWVAKQFHQCRERDA
jgi:hypothetical protein